MSLNLISPDMDLPNEKELQELFAEYFLSSEKNDGYRWFSRKNISIDFGNREITFILDPNEKNWGAESFDARVKADTDFIDKRNLPFLRGFNFEQEMYDGVITKEDHEKAKNYNTPQIGGRVVITETSMYLDESGELFVAIPLAKPEETYGLAGKLTGANMIRGSSAPKIYRIRDKLNPQSGKNESNGLFEKQKKYKKEKIIEEASNFKFGEWSVNFQIPGKRATKMNNVHIGRANDGTFEILSSRLFYSYEDIIEHYNIKENIGFDRPVSLVKVSDLLECKDGGELPIQKLFYQNEHISIEDLPDSYKGTIQKSSGKMVIDDFHRTPPLKQFEGKLKTLLLTDEFKGVTNKILSKQRGHRKKEIGEKKEISFGEKFQLEKHNIPFNGTLRITSDYKEIIEKSSYPADTKKQLILFLDKEKQRIEGVQDICKNGGGINKGSIVRDFNFNVHADFILPLPNGKVSLIEYKKSKKAITSKQQILVKLFMLFTNNNVESYNIIVGNNYGTDRLETGEGIFRYSERYLEEQGIKTQDKLIEFLQENSK